VKNNIKKLYNINYYITFLYYLLVVWLVQW